MQGGWFKEVLTGTSLFNQTLVTSLVPQPGTMRLYSSDGRYYFEGVNNDYTVNGKLIVFNAGCQPPGGVSAYAEYFTLNTTQIPASHVNGPALSLAGGLKGRLTLASGTPVTTADLTGKTQLFYTPFVQGSVQPECSILNTGLPASTVFDVFYNPVTNAISFGTAWTTTTAGLVGGGPIGTVSPSRTVALTQYQGYFYGANPLLPWIGIVATDASSQFNDSAATRTVCNGYNKVLRTLSSTLGSSSSNTTLTGIYLQVGGAGFGNGVQVTFILDGIGASKVNLIGMGGPGTTTTNNGIFTIGSFGNGAGAEAPGSSNNSITGSAVGQYYCTDEEQLPAGFYTRYLISQCSQNTGSVMTFLAVTPATNPTHLIVQQPAVSLKGHIMQ